MSRFVLMSCLSADADRATRLRNLLSANGLLTELKVVFPRTGADQSLSIHELQGSDFFLPCLSTEFEQQRRTSLQRSMYNALRALDEVNPKHEWLIPVRLDDVPVPRFAMNGFTFESHLSADLFGEGLAAGLISLLHRLEVDTPSLDSIMRKGAPSL